ncbi:MAG: uroporphyrinogen decarboxylase family protein [Eubacterium sp.]
MLSIKDNFLEVLHGGNPDRFVKQYEFMDIILEAPSDKMCNPGETIVNSWGVTMNWPEGQLGGFPIHDAEHIVVKDITEWKKYVKVPSVIFTEEAWAPAMKRAEEIREKGEKYVTAFVAPGLFEMTHHLMSMDEALVAYYEEPECMQEMMEVLVEHELAYAKEVVEHLHPECIFHHDDWGGQRSTFLSPAMFDEFILPGYKKIYQFYKDHGVELIVHHSDCFAATIVPEMIEMGVNVWQGCMTTNNVPELIEKYGQKITFMGDIDSGVVDFPGWNREITEKYTRKACEECGKVHFIPCLTQGLGFSSFPGVYEATDEIIDELSKEMF